MYWTPEKIQLWMLEGEMELNEAFSNRFDNKPGRRVQDVYYHAHELAMYALANNW
jgi:hypothetical protein